MKAWLKWLGCGALLGLLAWLVAWSVRTLTGGEGAVTWWLALGAIALVPAAASVASRASDAWPIQPSSRCSPPTASLPSWGSRSS